jgi:hypothetical protein
VLSLGGEMANTSHDGSVGGTTRIHLDSSGSPLADSNNGLNLIAVAAYYKAEARGFTSRYEEEDWLEAEAEIDRHSLRS